MATAIYKDSGNIEFNTEQVQGKKTIKSIKKKYLTAITLFLVILIALALVLWATLKTGMYHLHVLDFDALRSKNLFKK